MAGRSRSLALPLQRQGETRQAPHEKCTGTGPQKGTRIMVNSASAGKRRYLPSSPFKPPPEPPPVEQYTLHDLVTHEKYGLGRVILVEGDTGG